MHKPLNNIKKKYNKSTYKLVCDAGFLSFQGVLVNKWSVLWKVYSEVKVSGHLYTNKNTFNIKWMFDIMLYVKYIGTPEYHYVVYIQYNNDNIADIVTLIHRFADFIEGSPHLMPNEVSVHVQEYGFGGSFFEDEFFDTDDEEDEIKPMMKPEWDSTVFAIHVNGNSCYFLSERWAENSSQWLLCKVPDRLSEEGLRKAWIVASATRTTLSLGFQCKKQSQAEQFGPICYQQKNVLL